MAKFDLKTFNAEAFGSYVETLPQANKNELIKSRVLVVSEQIKSLLSTQTGSYFGTIPFFGRIDGDAVNYDGKTNITASELDTFEQSVIAVGRAKGWVEKDFAVDITAGVQFMDEVAKQVATYWDDVNTGIILSILKGVFAMNKYQAEKDFVAAHTHDVSTTGNGTMAATTLNVAIQKACGDKRSKFGLVFMHSAVATNLENLNLLEFLKYTDANGVQRPLPMASWNGRLVIVDDGMPFEEGYFPATSSDEGALQVKASGATDGQINADEVTPFFGTGTPATDSYVVKGVRYTTYVFGEGAIQYADLGADVPYEMSRDAATNGGQTTLYSRERLCFAPYGISFVKTSVASLSPTNAELENGQNWLLVNNGKTSGSRKTINHKDIAIARIFTRG